MKLFKQKKGIILHPWTWIVISFILGMILMFAIMKEYLVVPFLSC